jgi:hypothetical protein
MVSGRTKYGLEGSGRTVRRVGGTGRSGAGKTPTTGSPRGVGDRPGTVPENGGGGEKDSGARTEDQSTKQTGSGNADLTGEDRKALEQLRQLLGGGGKEKVQDPKELLRLYKILADSVENLVLSKDKGDPWIKLAKFLDKNREKIEGKLRSGPGDLSQEEVQKIIDDFGKFIEAEEEEKEPDKLEKIEDYDKLLAYNPNWQKMSPADRKLLLEYAKMTPEEIEQAPINFSTVTTDMKVSMALKLSKSWPAEVAEAAKNAFSDPGFVIMLIVTIGIYVGLWLTPDPTWITKLAAGTLTAVMLAQFAWQDIYGTAKAWMELQDACKKAKTVKELQEAGDAFAKQIGAVGFDILLFIAMWGLGKVAGPKLSKIGAQRGVARAEAGVRTAEAKPGSGVQQPATGEAAKILDKAGRPTPSATLDALADMLPDEAAKKGLSQLRNIPGGDLQTLRILKGELAKGNDIGRFLSEKGQSPDVRTAAKASLWEAKSKLARAKLIEAETIKDPALREAVRSEQLSSIKQILQEAGILNDPKIQRAIKVGKTAELVGELGEAIQRTQLRAKYPASQGYSVMSNVEVVQQVPGYDSIPKWQAAERAAGRSGDPGGLYEKGGKLWKSLGNADALVTKAGPDGRLQPIEIEEVKTGEMDSPTKAAGQVRKVTTGLGQIAGGQEGIRIFDRIGKNEIGRDLTDQFDLSQLESLKTSVRGPEGKGYDASLGFDSATLNAVGDSLVKNLPPAKLPVIPPVVSPRKKEGKLEEEDEEQLTPAGH